MSDQKRLWHKRLPDFESFDRIELQVDEIPAAIEAVRAHVASTPREPPPDGAS